MSNDFLTEIENKFNLKNKIKVEDVSFSTSLNKLEIKLIYDDNYSQEIQNKKEEIISYIQTNFTGGIDCDIQLKKSFIDEDYLKVILRKYVVENSNNLIKNLNLDNVIVSKTEKTFFIILKVDSDKGLGNFYEELLYKFINSIKDNYFYNFEIKVEYLGNEKTEKNEKYIESYIKTLEENSTITIEEVEEYITLSNKMVVVGALIQDDAMDLEQINSAQDYVVLCGECENVKFVDYQKEKINKETNQKIMTDGKRCSFDIKYGETAFPCTYFLKKDDFNKEIDLKDGYKVCVDGKVDEFRGNLSLKVKNINLCEFIPKKQKEIVYLPIPKNYTKVFPEPFYAEEQVDMFSLMEAPVIQEKEDTKNYVVFDLETTGLSSSEDKIIEISAIKIENGQMTECFNSFVNPEIEIPPKIQELTNIDNEMVKDAPKDYEIIGDLLKFCEGCTMVAYNAPFDMGFLQMLAYRTNYKIENEVDDALVLARNKILGLKNYKLKKVAEYLNVDLVGAHRAINDTLATAKVYLKLLKM